MSEIKDKIDTKYGGQDTILTFADYDKAMLSQSACNLTGLLHGWAAISAVIMHEGRARGEDTDWINLHPINRLLGIQVAYLTGTSTSVDSVVYEALSEFCKERAVEKLDIPAQIQYWRVDECMECLSFGEDRRMVEAALLTLMPTAYGESEAAKERETPPEPDADPEFKLSAIWDRLTDYEKRAIIKAAAHEFRVR